MSYHKAIIELGSVYALAALAGFAASRIGLPLPWMIGPLLSTGLLVFTGMVEAVVPVATRPWGQGVVASQVGLYFTPAAFASLIERVPLVLSMALLTIVVAAFVALVLSRLARIPLSTAMIATLPANPVDASMIAERYGFLTTPIILSQTLRISAVVVLIPLAVYAVNGRPEGGAGRLAVEFDLAGIALLVLAAVTGGRLFSKLGVSSPYFLGPLALVSLLSAAGLDLDPFPAPIQWAAQILLGTWLGSTFRRHLFYAAGRLVGASVATTLFFIILSAGPGIVLAQLLGMHWVTMVLALAPGGVTEMALTASILEANVALVTAIQITRIFLINLNIAWIIALMHSFENRNRR